MEPDPDSTDGAEFQVTYEIADEDDRAGQLGVTTLSSGELVADPA